MKIKTFCALDNEKLDKKVNAFLDNHEIEVVDITFQHNLIYFSVLVVYK